MRIAIIIFFLTACGTVSHAQNNQKQEAWMLLQRMSDTYKQSAGLSFNVLFRYASEAAPDHWLDSLDGRFIVNGQQYWSEISNTETICTGGYVIMLFKDDQLMYLTKPAKSDKAVAGGMTAGVTGFAGQMEQYLKNDSTIRWSLTELRHQKKITLEFTVPSVYKRIEYYISKQTGLLQKTVNVVKSDQLYDASVRQAVAADESYAVVEAIYSNQKKGGVDDQLFNPDRYFKKEDNEYITVAPYQTYKLFPGSSNL